MVLRDQPIAFEVKKVLYDYHARAARYALSTICPKTGESSSTEAIAEDAIHMVRQRRARFVQLRQYGSEQLAEPRRYWFMLNCPPVGVLCVQNHPKSCGLRRFCPFCWTRYYTFGLYDALQWFFYGGNAEQQVKPAGVTKVQPKPYDIIEVTRAVKFESELEPENIIRAVLPARNDLRDAVVKECQPLGTFRAITLQPPDLDKHRWWLLQIRVVAVTSPRSPNFKTISGELSTEWSRRSCNPSRRGLAAVAGRGTLYPAQLLIGSAQHTAEWLDYNDKTRLMDYTGCLRNRGERERMQNAAKRTE